MLTQEREDKDMTRTKTMQEKRYTFEAWQCAYEALESHIKWMHTMFIDGRYIDNAKTEFSDEEKVEMECYEEVMKIINDIA